MTSNTDAYRAARDGLVATIGDYDKAATSFEWPGLPLFVSAAGGFTALEAECPL
jgi:hypothetical protein